MPWFVSRDAGLIENARRGRIRSLHRLNLFLAQPHTQPAETMDTTIADAGRKPVTLIASIAILSILYLVSQIVYRLYFHPLSKIPGPWYNAITRIPYARHSLAGTTVRNVTNLHEKYGEAVRVSPNEVSFISGETAWQEVYGFRTGKMKGHASMQKDPAWYAPPPGGVQSIIIANDEDHTRFRRVLAHAFSDQALRGQEVLLHRYTDLCIDRLKETTASESATQDVTAWYVRSAKEAGNPLECFLAARSHETVLTESCL